MQTPSKSQQAFLYVALFIVFYTLTIGLTSCGSSRNVGNSYQKHLQHRHSGAHHLNNGNGGCGWSNN